MPQTGVEHMGDVGHKMLGKELKSRENRQKRLKSIGKTMRQLFDYCGAGGEIFYVSCCAKELYNNNF